MKTITPLLLWVIFVPIVFFVLTGAFDYFYIRHIVDQFESGLADVDFANPHLGKALVSGISALVGFLYLRLSGASPDFLKRIIGFTTTTGFAIATVTHLVAGITTWGHYFDALGKAILRYEITYDNRVVFYSKRTISPTTGLPLLETTPQIVHELETRRRLGSFGEVESPPAEHWFASGNAEPLLWYSEREDGIHVFNMSGYDPATRVKLQPVTPNIQRRYFEQKRAKDEREAIKAAEAADRHRKGQEAKERERQESAEARLASENSKLRAELDSEKQNSSARIKANEDTTPPRPVVLRLPTSNQATPEPQSEKKTTWQFKLLPDIKVYLEGQPFGGNNQRPAPLHRRCGTHHYQSDVCPATGLRYTN